MDKHDFDSMIRINKETFNSIQNIASKYEQKSKTLKESTIKLANNIMSSIKDK